MSINIRIQYVKPGTWSTQNISEHEQDITTTSHRTLTYQIEFISSNQPTPSGAWRSSICRSASSSKTSAPWRRQYSNHKNKSQESWMFIWWLPISFRLVERVLSSLMLIDDLYLFIFACIHVSWWLAKALAAEMLFSSIGNWICRSCKSQPHNLKDYQSDLHRN